MNAPNIVPEIPTVNRKKPFFGGFIMMPRNFSEWPLYHDSAAKELFLHLLISARYCDGRTLKRGQVETSLRKLCAELPGLSFQKIRTALVKLQEVEELAMEATHQKTVITLLKYDSYNGASPAVNTLTPEKEGSSTHHQHTDFGKAPKINTLIPENQHSYQHVQGFNIQSRKSSGNTAVNTRETAEQHTEAAGGGKSTQESTHWPPLLCTIEEYSTKLIEDRNSKTHPPAQRARVREGANHDDAMGRRMFFSANDAPEVPAMSRPVPSAPDPVPAGTRHVPNLTWREMPDAPRWRGDQPAAPEDVFVPKPEEDWQALAAAGNYRAAFEARVQVKPEVIDQILKSRNVSNEMFTAYLESRAASEFRGKSGRHLTNYSWLADLDIFCRHWRANREKALASANPGRAREGEPWRPWLTQKWSEIAAAITGASDKCGIASWWARHGMRHGAELERRCRAVIAAQEDVRAYA